MIVRIAFLRQPQPAVLDRDAQDAVMRTTQRSHMAAGQHPAGRKG